jgi:hypothetical protein
VVKKFPDLGAKPVFGLVISLSVQGGFERELEPIDSEEISQSVLDPIPTGIPIFSFTGRIATCHAGRPFNSINRDRGNRSRNRFAQTIPAKVVD